MHMNIHVHTHFIKSRQRHNQTSSGSAMRLTRRTDGSHHTTTHRPTHPHQTRRCAIKEARQTFIHGSTTKHKTSLTQKTLYLWSKGKCPLILFQQQKQHANKRDPLTMVFHHCLSSKISSPCSEGGLLTGCPSWK